jgi:hypothetical protein
MLKPVFKGKHSLNQQKLLLPSKIIFLSNYLNS